MKCKGFSISLILALGMTLSGIGLYSSAQAQGLLSCSSSGSEDESDSEDSEASSPSVSLVASSADGSEAESSIAVSAAWNTTLSSIDCDGENFIATLNLDLKTTIGTNDLLDGATILVSGDYRSFPTIVETEGDAPVRDTSKLQHYFVLSGGLQADTSFENFALLAEVGYSPMYDGFSGFALGPSVNNDPWIDVGAFLQAGYKVSTIPTSAVSPKQNAGDSSNEALLRLKLYGLGDIPLPVKLPGTQGFRIVPEAWAWYDVLDNRVYGLLKGKLSLEVNSEFSFDIIRFSKGSNPLTYAPESGFGTGITIRF